MSQKKISGKIKLVNEEMHEQVEKQANNEQV